MLKLSRLTTFTNYFIICTSATVTQNRALAEEITRSLPKKRCLGREGFPDSPWVLMDYGDIIIHIFLPEARQFYKLERTWADAPAVKIKEGPTTASK